jgi:hypothetical protein
MIYQQNDLCTEQQPITLFRNKLLQLHDGVQFLSRILTRLGNGKWRNAHSKPTSTHNE